MSAALGDVSKTQVDRLYKLGMPRHSAEAARAWRLDNLELSRTADSRIDRPQTPAPHAPRPAVGGLASAAGAGGDPSPPASSDDEPADPPEPPDENTTAYRADRARNERIKADRAELELLQMRNELVPVREVEQLQFTAGRITRDRVLMVPARLAADLHALALSLMPEAQREAFGKALALHELERRLDTELRAALSEAEKAIEEAQRDDGPDE